MRFRHAFLLALAAPLWFRHAEFADRLNRSWTVYATELNSRFREMVRAIR